MRDAPWCGVVRHIAGQAVTVMVNSPVVRSIVETAIEVVVASAQNDAVRTGTIPSHPNVNQVIQVPQTSPAGTLLSILSAPAITLNQTVITAADITNPESFDPILAAHEARHADQQAINPGFNGDYFGFQVEYDFQTHTYNPLEVDAIAYGNAVGPTFSGNGVVIDEPSPRDAYSWTTDPYHEPWYLYD